MKRSHLVPARIISFVSIFLLLLTLVACGKPPDAELAAAQKTVADLARIEHFASNHARKTHDTLTSATNEIQSQKAKTFPSYSRARQLLSETMQQAEQTKSEAKTAAHRYAEAGLPLAQKVLAEARQRYASGDSGARGLPPGPEFDAQVFAAMARVTKGRALKSELDDFGKMLEQAQKDLDGGDPFAASSKIGTVLNECERYYPYIVDQVREPMQGK